MSRAIRVEEVIGDLFLLAPPDYALCHCVAADFGMGKGIALDFRRKYPASIPYLLKLGTQPGSVAILPAGKFGNSQIIFNLVTKEQSKDQPSWECFRSAVLRLAELCKAHKVSAVAMPRIGAGLDNLSWPRVLNLLRDTFERSPTKILIFHKPETIDSYPLVTVRPTYRGWQLLGDSQMVRFAKRFCSDSGSVRFPKQIGLCISGQTTQGLLLHVNINQLASKVVCMIGTNDVINMAEMECRQRDYKQNLRLHYLRLREILLESCDKVVFVTIPPIPKYGNFANKFVQSFNSLVEGSALKHPEKAIVLNTTSRFMNHEQNIDLSLFEPTMGPPWNIRQDLIHLNAHGLATLKECLDQVMV